MRIRFECVENQMLKRILKIAILILVLEIPCFAADGNNWFNTSLPIPLNEEFAKKFVERFKTNFDCGELSGISEVTQLAEFSCDEEGKIRWIYHPEHYVNQKTLPPATVEKIDTAIKLSGPVMAKKVRGVQSFALVLNPKPSEQECIYLCFCEHLCQFRIYVSEKRISHWMKDKCFAFNTSAVNTSLTAFSNFKSDTTSACWVSLNPDSTVEKILGVPVLIGKKLDIRASKQAEVALKNAIEKSKLKYEWAPALSNQPIGIVFLLRPGKKVSALPYLYDLPPYEAVWTKSETKTCECSE